jgi:30S ribosomal protein S31
LAPAAPRDCAKAAFRQQEQEFHPMGKGDSRTRKGKISSGSYGNSRPHDNVINGKPSAAATPPAKKAPAKKSPAKKA